MFGPRLRIDYEDVEILEGGVIIAASGAGRWRGDPANIRPDTEGRALLAEPLTLREDGLYLIRSCINDVEYELEGEVVPA